MDMIRTQKKSDRASLALVLLHFHYPLPQEGPELAANQGVPRHIFAHQSSKGEYCELRQQLYIQLEDQLKAHRC